MQTLVTLQRAFRSHGVEPPPEFDWIVSHGILGPEGASPLEPWHLCGVGEILPLRKRWPDAPQSKDLIPFARLQTGDDLACFELDGARITGICELHYHLSTPTYIEYGAEFPDLWAWLRGALTEVKLACELTRRREQR